MDEESLLYHLALTQIPQIGDIHIGLMLKYFEHPKFIFKARRRDLEHISGIGSLRANYIKSFHDFDRLKVELDFAHKSNVQLLVKGTTSYPSTLQECIDSPHVLYYKGTADLKLPKLVSVVGTRSPTEYGRERTAELIASLKNQAVTIVSGLAYGIDTVAHRESLKNSIPTIAVLGHGFKHIYPYANRTLACEMLTAGGLLTEFMHYVKPDKQNFPRRNRIVAGLSDVVVVMESGAKGGSLITADVANSYNKDVLAYPGRANDIQSIGCNQLIRTNKANLITCGQELIDFMNWVPANVDRKAIQVELFLALEENERLIYEIIAEKQPVSLDDLSILTELRPSILAAMVLSLEMKNLIHPVPGKLYKTASR